MQYLLFSHLFFIAKRISFNKKNKKQIFYPAIRIAIISITLSLTIMIISVAIVTGFKNEVQNKIIGFGSHLQITNSDNNIFYESSPITINTILLKKLKHVPNISHIQSFATKPAIIKTKDSFQGVILKGIDKDFDWFFFKKNLIKGNLLISHSNFSNTSNVILSKNITDKLHLKLNDTFKCYFIQNPIRIRNFRITGIYQTNFEDFDKLFILINITQIRNLNNWDKDMISGFEILVKNYDHLNQTMKKISYILSNQTDRLKNNYYVRSIKQLNPIIFAWLDILNINVIVILILMLFVAIFSMIAGLLIIILKYANMIGLLKALGETNRGIRKIFLYVSIFLIGKGLLWGNIIALSICFIQKCTGILKLNPKTYYLSIVPIHLSIVHFFLINIGTFIISLLILIIPSNLVGKILPAKTIRFE